MQQSFDIFFASSNKNKYLEAKKILANFGINLGFFKTNLEEIQADSIKEIGYKKSVDAFCQCKKPVIVEDDGLLIDSLNGFPGPYSSFMFETIGNNGILRLLKSNRNARFQSVIAFCDKKKEPKTFSAYIHGKIANKSQGKGWGFDPIFIPCGKRKTYAELKEKNAISHRYLALRKFAKWFLGKQESIYQ